MPTIEEILAAQQTLENDAASPELSRERSILAGLSGIGREGGPLAAMEQARKTFQAPAKQKLEEKRTSLEKQKSTAFDQRKLIEQGKLEKLKDVSSAESKQIRDAYKKALKAAMPKLDVSFMDSYSGDQLGELSAVDAAKLAIQGMKDSSDRKVIADERNQAIQDRQDNAMLERYSKKLTDSGMTQLGDTLDEIETLVSGLPKDKAGKPQDIPGYGRAASLIPTFLTTGDARRLRSAVGKLQNVQLKQRSGAAVTVPEFARFMQEFGSGKLESEQALTTGISRLRRALEADRAELERGLTPEAKEEHVKRGGRLSNYEAPVEQPAMNLSKLSDEQLEARRAELLKKAGK